MGCFCVVAKVLYMFSVDFNLSHKGNTLVREWNHNRKAHYQNCVTSLDVMALRLERDWTIIGMIYFLCVWLFGVILNMMVVKHTNSYNDFFILFIFCLLFYICIYFTNDNHNEYKYCRKW